ncbi:type I secretion system permease/ATPase [Litchfieldella xinjiangensis]|uniref:type I secretion system permease/ATPase n=1 Tax=Litchfieldella xinjiangensis TaxID=1166948 RepID=UPI0005BBC7E1|nr:type I secretion system permease/ATPase [Halomonas xinjiangensis]
MSTTQSAKELQTVLSQCRGSFIAVAFFSMFVNLLMLAPPLYMLQVYDRVITTRSNETLLMLSLLIVFLFVVMGGLELVRSRILVRVGNRLDAMINQRLYSAMFKKTLALPGKPSAQPLNDLSSVRQFLSGNGLFAFFDMPWVPVYLGVLFLFHPWFGYFALGAGVILFTLALINERVTRGLLAEANIEHVQSQDLANSNLRNAEVLHAMGMLPAIMGRWSAKHQDYLIHQSKASDHAGTLTNLSKVLRVLFQSLILGLGAYLVIQGSLTAGMMIAGSIIMGRALAPIDQIIGGWKGFVGARTAYQRLNELLNVIPADEPNMPLPAPRGRVTLEEVSVAPPGERHLTLRGIDLDVEVGEHIGIVGPSAAGKSTLARTILGIWPAQMGCVRLDGADITQWKREALGPYLGYLPQDIELFDGTISENIARFGEIDPAKVVEATRKAGVHEMILRQPNGYDTYLSAGGSSLSCGQRQRIGLARALYGNPVLVVLDEPNANLDKAGEHALSECVQRLKQEGTTLFVISHRHSILKHVDRLLVLKDGQLNMLAPPEQIAAQQSRPVRGVAGAPRAASSRPTSIRQAARGKNAPLAGQEEAE